MVRYSKPVWQMVKEAAEKMREITAKDVKQYIRDTYPTDNVNELTVSAQVIACSVNHPSAHHYPDSQRFLFYLGNGKYRLYAPERDGVWEKTPRGTKKVSDGIKSGNCYFSQVKSGGFIFLPRIIQEKLLIKEDDFVAFVENSDGEILLRKGELRIVD